MSNIFVGTVAAKSGKQLKSGMFYSICVKDENGDEEWFRTAKKEAPVEKGNRVKFKYTEDKYGKHVDLASLQVKEGEPVRTGKAATQGGGAEKTDWTAKDRKIGYMAASKQAVPLVIAAMEREFLGIPKSKKPAEKMDLFMEYVKLVTEDLFRTYESVPERYDEIMSGEEEDEVDFDANLEEEVEAEEVEEDEDW